MAKVTEPSTKAPRRRPALTPEAREQQLISYAVDLVEKRLLEGTASSQETTHFLKLATAKYRLETQKAELENELISAKTESLRSAKRSEETYAKAINAMRRYAGHGDGGEIDEDDW